MMWIKRVWNSDTCVLFSQQMGNLLESGIPLLSCLELLTEQNVIPEQAGTRLALQIEQGASFSQALKQEKFPDLFVSFIRASEEHGDFIFGLKQCETYFATRAKWRRELMQASIYPLLVLGLVGLSFIFMITMVLPRFSELYETMGIDLPWITVFLLSALDYLRFIFLIAGGGCLFLLILSGVSRSWSVESRARFFDWYLKFPFIRQLYQYRLTHYVSVQLGSLLRAGVPLLTSLELMERLTPWAHLSLSIKEIKAQLMEGYPFSLAVSQPGTGSLFLPALSKMVAIGEQSGKLDETLLGLAHATESLMKNKAERLTRSLEPILIFVMGVFIAFTVIAMFMPLLQLVRAL